MAIETFVDLQKDVKRNPVKITISNVEYYGYQVSTYTVNEGDAIKIGDNLEVLINQTWFFYLWSFDLQSWTDISGGVVEISILLGGDVTTTSIVNEGDVYVTRQTVLQTGTTRTGEDVYAILEEDETGSYLVWYNLDRSRYEGPVNDINLTTSGDSISSSVSVVYAQTDSVSNTWLYLLYVVTIDNSGNILQTQYLTENGIVFIVGNLPVADQPIADQVAEVYSFKSENAVISINFGDFVSGREVLAITLNIITPRTRKYGEGRSALILGSTVQMCPLGRKVLHLDRFSGHKIKTYPRLEISSGSTCECDLMLSIPATVIKNPNGVSSVSAS
jgi:hypothetical protein